MPLLGPSGGDEQHQAVRIVEGEVFAGGLGLRVIEDDIARGRKPPQEMRAALEELDAKVERVMVPLSYTDELYALRSAIAQSSSNARTDRPSRSTTFSPEADTSSSRSTRWSSRRFTSSM